MADSDLTLDDIHVRFATFRDRSAEARAGLAASLAEHAGAEHVQIETCHRVELVSVDSAPAAEGVLTGREAVRRVLEVVAGFDSAVVAEEQLLGQVRVAYENALAAGTTGPILNELFRLALRFGRRVRAHARPGTDRSLADPALAWLAWHLPPAPAHVVIVGTGEMARRSAEALAKAGHRLTIVSGSAERGRRLRDLLAGSGHDVAVGALRKEVVHGAGALVLAVRSRGPQLTGDLLEAAGKMPWTLDFSAPSAVSPDAATRLGDRLLDLDGLASLAGASPVLEPSVERRLRGELEDEVDAFVRWLEMRRSVDALTALQEEAAQVRHRHLQRLRRRGNLDAGQLEVVEATVTAMLGELLHGPTIELRRGGGDAATVRRLFGLRR